MPYGFGSRGTLDPSLDTPPQQPQPQAPQMQRNPQLDALAEQLMKTLQQPQPTAPLPPSFGGLPPIKAAAAAMNPYLGPQLVQQEMSPDVARYQQAQAQFEAAMQGRREATAAATSLAGRDLTGQYAMMRPRGNQRPIVRNTVELAQDGQYHLMERFYDPNDVNVVLRENDRGPARQGYNYQIDNMGNVVQFPSQGAPLPTGGGGVNTGTKGPQPAGVATDLSKSRAALESFKSIKDTWRQYQEGSRLPAFAQGALEYGLRSFPGTTRSIAPTRDYSNQAQFKSDIDQKVFRYINSLSGKQYTIKEMETFRQFFPFSWDDEATVDRKMANLKQAVLQDIAKAELQFPQTARPGTEQPGAAPTSGPSPELQDFMRRNNLTVKP